MADTIKHGTEHSRPTPAELGLYNAYFEATSDAIVVIDLAGCIRLANARTEALFGYCRSELIGSPVELLIPEGFPDQHSRLRASFSAEPRSRAVNNGLELYGLRKDRSVFPIEISLNPLETDGEFLMSGGIRDITTQKMLEQRAYEANRLKNEFMANMSHELRTPLNAIIGFTELMHLGKAGPITPLQQEYLGDILTSSQHLLRIINDILDLAKVEAGKIDISPEELNPAKLVGEVRDLLRELARRKRLHVNTEIDDGIGAIFADPVRVKQVLYNYLSNAIKFTLNEGTIVVRVADDAPGFFRLSVSDTGIGIAEADLGRLFVEFQQLDTGSAKKFQGTGLGLALTKRIVEAHGGRVEVSSVEGAGSMFSAILPKVLEWPRD